MAAARATSAESGRPEGHTAVQAAQPMQLCTLSRRKGSTFSPVQRLMDLPRQDPLRADARTAAAADALGFVDPGLMAFKGDSVFGAGSGAPVGDAPPAVLSTV